MKSVGIGICLALATVATANLFPGRAQEAGAARRQPPTVTQPVNPLRVALLRWYRANTTTRFTVGSQPYGVAFDGANIWTANFGDGTVTKLRANDGEVLGTFKLGGAPYGVTFDGANVWVSNQGEGAVTKLRATDGKALGTFAVGPFPGWAAFDGANIWVTTVPSEGAGKVSKVRASDGQVLGTFTVGVSPVGVAFDGSNVWMTNGGGTVSKLRASDGNIAEITGCRNSTMMESTRVSLDPEARATDSLHIRSASLSALMERST